MMNRYCESQIRRFAPVVLGMMLASVAPAPALAQEGDAKSRSEIRDTAKLFDPEAVREARAVLANAEQTTHIPVIIETVDSLDGGEIEAVAARRGRQTGTQGFYMLISKGDQKFSSLVSRRQIVSRVPTVNRVTIRGAFEDEFRKGDFNAGLKRGVEAIADVLIRSTPVAPAPVAAEPEAADSTLVLRNQARLTLGGARRVLAAAEAKAAEMKLKMNIAIVDEGGHLLTFARMDGARPASAATALTKAITAATFRQATGPLPPGGEPDVLLNLSLQNAAAASGGKLTTLYGGVPIVIDGQVIGAVGVGGGRGEQDAEVARAGIEALMDELKKTGKGDDADQ